MRVGALLRDGVVVNAWALQDGPPSAVETDPLRAGDVLLLADEVSDRDAARALEAAQRLPAADVFAALLPLDRVTLREVPDLGGRTRPVVYQPGEDRFVEWATPYPPSVRREPDGTLAWEGRTEVT